MIVNRLPQILAERGLSIRELARRTGITYSTIWAVVHSERRSVQLEVLEAICQVLSTQPGEIYTLVSEDNPFPAPPTKAALSDDKKRIRATVDSGQGGKEVAASQQRRRGRPADDWRSW